VCEVRPNLSRVPLKGEQAVMNLARSSAYQLKWGAAPEHHPPSDEPASAGAAQKIALLMESRNGHGVKKRRLLQIHQLSRIILDIK
jgi:hypothetical protein